MAKTSFPGAPVRTALLLRRRLLLYSMPTRRGLPVYTFSKFALTARDSCTGRTHNNNTGGSTLPFQDRISDCEKLHATQSTTLNHELTANYLQSFRLPYEAITGNHRT
jgi:hypothetical protein